MFKKALVIFVLLLGLPSCIGIMVILSNGNFQGSDPEVWNQHATESYNQGNYAEAARFYNKRAFYFWENNKLDEAADSFISSVKANEKIGNQNAVMHIYNNLGQIYFDKGLYERSEDYFLQNLAISREQDRRHNIASGLINIANVRNELGDYDAAIDALQEAEAIAREVNDMTLLRNSYAMLAQAHERIGEDSKSKGYFDLYYALERKLQEEQMQRSQKEAKQRISHAETKAKRAETEKELTREELGESEKTLQITRQTLDEVEEVSRERQLQINLLNKEKQLQDEQLKRQQAVRNGLIIFGILLAIVAALILHNYLQKKKANRLLSKSNQEISEQNDEIAKKNKELQKTYFQIKKQNKNISASIAYAQRIQQAMLSNDQNLKKHLPESFIYYKPRDIVSGDFYWFSEVELTDLNSSKKTGKGLVIACVDCTGHGVPGAFMSMIGINLLENITSKGVETAGKILEELHTSIRKSLRQHKNDNRDGMELSVCVIREEQKVLEYAGAKSPLFYINNDGSHFIKGDPAPIGGIQPEPKREFTNHRINVISPTTFYLFTDGYADQFGGPNGYKFSTRKLRNLLMENSIDRLDQQKDVLDKNFISWKNKKHKQLDDVLVMGFTI